MLLNMNIVSILNFLKRTTTIFIFYAGRQPVVCVIESALDRCTNDWKEQNAEMNGKLDMLLDLQRQRIKLDEERLQFE